MLTGIVTPSSSAPSAVADAFGVTLVSESMLAPRRSTLFTELEVVAVAAPEPFQSPKSFTVTPLTKIE